MPACHRYRPKPFRAKVLMVLLNYAHYLPTMPIVKPRKFFGRSYKNSRNSFPGQTRRRSWKSCCRAGIAQVCEAGCAIFSTTCYDQQSLLHGLTRLDGDIGDVSEAAHALSVMQAVMPGLGCEQLELDGFAALACEHQSRQADHKHWHGAFEVLHDCSIFCFMSSGCYIDHTIQMHYCDALTGSVCSPRAAHQSSTSIS